MIAIQIFSWDLTIAELAVIAMVALFIGMAKTGVHGAGMVAVPLLAAAFGGKVSSGILLPILIMADVFGVTYYHRHASWKHLVKLFPWAILGVLIGVYTGHYINDETFKAIMAVIIFVSVIIMLWLENTNKKAVPDYYWFAIIMGIAAGFTTMVGNLAGSVAALYLLSMRLPKNAFIGTAAWFFMVLNWFKVPFHILVWGTIDWNTLQLDILFLPIIGLGAWVGVTIIKRIPEKGYRWFIIGSTLVAALMMLI